MNPERWQQIWDLFFAALQQPAAERRSFVARAAQGDTELENEVSELLASHDKEDPKLSRAHRLGTSIAELATLHSGELPDELIGTQVGPYRIVRLLGEGGMGRVYEAEQLVSVRRRVAFKVIKLGMDTREIVRRFETERQALALMQHPNIAHVYDAGAISDGRPYFVMEMVAGETITEFCDQQLLSVRARLQLFVTLCDAVQHAHQKGVVHRDLKPSNVLVDHSSGAPVAKVIDFGIAKAVGGALSDLTLADSRAYVIGTPAYMSPEQATVGSVDIDTRADVYSLSALLYELMIGEPPFAAATTNVGSYAEALRLIRETEPRRPSQQLSTLPGGDRDNVAHKRSTNLRGLGGQLRELDWIVLKGLAKDRELRYATPQELASDIRRFLDGQPVLARPPSVSYRVRKFVGRHRFGVGAGATIVLLLAAFAISMTVQSIRLEQALQAEARQRLRAERVSRFLVDMVKLPDPYVDNGENLTVRAVLDQGAASIERELNQEPQIKATLQQTMGHVYRQLGLYTKSQQQLEQALELLRKLHDPRGLGNTLVALGELRHDEGDLKRASEYYLQGLRVLRSSPGADTDTAVALNDLVQLYCDSGEYDAAIKAGEEAVAINATKRAADDLETPLAMQNLARAYKLAGRAADAGRLYDETLKMLRRQGRSQDAIFAVALNHYGLYLRSEYQLAAAEQALRDALAIQRRTLPARHSYLAVTVNNLATVQLLAGRYREARAGLNEARDIWQSQFGTQHNLVATARFELARIDLIEAKQDVAVRDLREVLALDRETYGEKSLSFANTQDLLGWALREQGKLDEAETAHRSMLAIRLSGLGDAHPNVALARTQLALTLIKRNNLSEAESLLTVALRTLETSSQAQPLALAGARNALAQLRVAQQRMDQAATLFSQVADARKARLGDSHPDTADANSRLAALLCQRGDRQTGRELQQRAMQVLGTSLGSSHPRTRKSLAELQSCQ